VATGSTSASRERWRIALGGGGWALASGAGPASEDGLSSSTPFCTIIAGGPHGLAALGVEDAESVPMAPRFG
jgi:hypothetical protein